MNIPPSSKYWTPLDRWPIHWTDEVANDLRKYYNELDTLIPGCWVKRIFSRAVSMVEITSFLFRGLKIQFCDKTERTELREIRHLGFKINQTKLLVEDTAGESSLTPCSEKLLHKKCYGSRQNSILLHTVSNN